MRAWAAAFAGTLACLLACAPSPPPGGGQAASPLSGPDADGKTISLPMYAGRVVLVDFWASWCDPCRAEMPELARLQQRLGPKGFTVLGVSMDEDRATALRFAKANGINYPVILLGTERPPPGWVVPGLPTAYLVGRDARLLQRYFGAKSAEKLAADIEAALSRR